MMKFLPALFASLLLVSACIVQTPTSVPPSELEQSASAAMSIVQSSSASSVGIAEGDLEEKTASSAAPIAVSQHLLTGGLLEIGEASTPLNLLLFTNHFCSYCKEFHETYLPRLLAEYVQPGKLRIVTIPFPLKKYPESTTAAITLYCSAKQGQGREMHDLLFQGSMTNAALQAQIKALNLNAKMLQECLRNPLTEQILVAQKNTADALGVTLVPTLFLNGDKTVGLPTYAELRGMIDAVLASGE